VHRATGDIVGEGLGACSTLESKYIDRPRDLENTVIKMAQKRGAVAAALNAFALSDRFTQDLEDLPRDDEEVETGQTQAQQPQREPERAEDLDERGVALMMFGADTIKGHAIDERDTISIGLLVSTLDWLDKNESARTRFANVFAQILPEIVKRVRDYDLPLDDADLTKTMKWIVKNEQRRARFAPMLEALDQRMADEQDVELAKQKAESVAGVGIADDVQKA
jgi:hypothetical protein